MIVRGTTEEIAYLVGEHLDAGADHVSRCVLTRTPEAPPTQQWRELAAQLLHQELRLRRDGLRLTDGARYPL